jgi:hypothetical protein
MNANELADLLEVDSWYKLVTREEISTMLRQQEKELTDAGHMIGVLREYISDLENGLESSIKLNKVQALRKAQEK